MTFIYKALEYNKMFLVGCLATNGDSTKITFNEFQDLEEETIQEKWDWYNKNIQHDHLWYEMTEDFVKQKEILNDELDQELATRSEGNIPNFIYTTNKEILLKVKENMDTEDKDILKLNLFITKSMILMKIAQFFSEKPILLFEFPLYQEYVEKNQLPDLSVEDFLVEIEKSIQLGLL